MNLSLSNITKILRRGLEKGYFSEKSLRKRLFAENAASFANIEITDAILIDLAREIQFHIEKFHPLSLQRDINLHNGKEYFRLIFHDKISTYVLSRILNDELKEAFNLEMKSRFDLIDKLLVETGKTLPKAIIRSDIKSFFESVDHRRLFDNMHANPDISDLSMSYFKLIFSEFNRHRLLPHDASRGLPRGLSISSYLAEIYLKDLDSEISGMPHVEYYGRYVDDIIILINQSSEKDPKEIFDDVVSVFERAGLTLHDDSESKTSIYDLSSDRHYFGNYLGYNLNWEHSNQSLILGMPDWKIKRKKEMIDKAFCHFEQISRKDVKKARHDLIDCLNFISGNFNLKGSKKNIRSGLFYANPHLSDLSSLDDLTNYLHSKSVLPYISSFSNDADRIKFISRIKSRISKIDFRKNWIDKKMFSFNPTELGRIKAILRMD